MKLPIFLKRQSTTVEDPIQQLKNIMRYEAVVQILSLLSFCLFPIFFRVSELGKQILMVAIVYGILLSAYYLWQFYTFYQCLNRENTIHLAEELELQIGKYKAWSWQLSPVALALIGVPFFEKGIFNKMMKDAQFSALFIVQFILVFTAMFLIGKYWLKSSYYKYVDLLRTSKP